MINGSPYYDVSFTILFVVVFVLVLITIRIDVWKYSTQELIIYRHLVVYPAAVPC